MDIKQAAQNWTDNDLLRELEEIFVDRSREWTQEIEDDYNAVKSEIFKRMATGAK